MSESVKLKRAEIIELKHILETTDFVLPISTQYRYMATKNLEAIQEVSEDIDKMFPIPKEVNEYRVKRSNIYAKYEVKDKNVYDNLAEDVKTELDKEINKLEEDSKEILDKAAEYDKEKIDFLEEEVEIKLRKVKMKYMPDISQNNVHNHWDIWFILLKLVIDDSDE